MTRARRQQVALCATPYYHCISRCVRRAFLCGSDRYTGQNFDHRRDWMLERLAQLQAVFAIDLCAYALMSNHYHLVLRVDVATASGWGEREVAERWMRLFSGPLLVRRYLRGDALDAAERQVVSERLAVWRERLMDISWFMRCLNEHVARRANEEDGCKGRFWEGRFKSQALLDEKALLACMAYVDLNPVRAGVASTPESSEYTSIKQRADELLSIERGAAASSESALAADRGVLPRLLPLMSVHNIESSADEYLCGVRLMDYLELVDWTGRAVRRDKRGAVAVGEPAVLHRLDIDRRAWLRHMRPRPNRLLQAVGSLAALKEYARQVGKRWLLDRALCAGLHN